MSESVAEQLLIRVAEHHGKLLELADETGKRAVARGRIQALFPRDALRIAARLVARGPGVLNMTDDDILQRFKIHIEHSLDYTKGPNQHGAENARA